MEEVGAKVWGVRWDCGQVRRLDGRIRRWLGVWTFGIVPPGS